MISDKEIGQVTNDLNAILNTIRCDADLELLRHLIILSIQEASKVRVIRDNERQQISDFYMRYDLNCLAG